MQTNKEIGLADLHADEPILGIPIKKRLFHMSQSSSSTCQNTPTVPKNSSEQPRKLFLKSECSVSENSAGVKLDSNVSPDDLLESSIRLTGLHGFPSQVNQKIGLKKGTTGSGESSMHDELDVDIRASIGFGIEKGKNSSVEFESEMLKGKEAVGKIIASSDVSSSEEFETSGLYLSSCQDMQCSLNLSKKVINETCPLDLPGANKPEHHQTSYNDLESQCASNLYSSRKKWDLNFPMEVWDTNLNNLAINHGMNNELKLKDLHQPNDEKIPIQNTQVIANNFGLRLSMVELHQRNMKFTNLEMPVDGATDYVDGLDLQLRLPSRPKLCDKLGVSPLDLSLSLTGNLSDASFTTVKPEPCVNHNQKDTKRHQFSSLNSGVIAQVKSEPCDGSFHVTSQIEDPSLDKEVKHELPEEFQVKSPNLVLGNHPLASLTRLPTALDSNSLCHANILYQPNPTLLSVANTSLDERTCQDLNPSTISDSMIFSKVDSCINQDAKGSSSKPLANVEPILSYVKGCTAEDRVICVTVGKDSSQRNEFVESDPKEPSACDGLSSERRAEMNLSGEECTVSKFLANSKIDSGLRKEPIFTGGNQEGMDLSANIQIDQCVVDAEQRGAPEGPKGKGNKVTSHGVGDCEDSERQCANESQCQYKNKLDARVATVSISSEGFPFMTDVHVDTKGKEIQTEGVSAHGAVMCHDKRGTASGLNTDLPKLPVIMELTASSNKPVKTCQGTREKHLGKDNVSQVRSSSIEASPATAKNKNEYVKNKTEYVGGGQMSTKAISVAMKHPILREGESNVNSPATKHVYNPFKHSHIKHDDSRFKYREGNKVTSPSTKSFGYRNATSARSVPDGTEKERLIDDNEKHVNLYSQGRRHSKFETNNHDQTIGQRESDYMNNRRNYNHHFTRDPDIQHGPGHSNPRKSRYMRHNEETVPFIAPPNGSTHRSLRRMTDYPNGSTHRSLRRMTDYPQDRLFPSWRQPQGPREQPSGRRQIKDTDTNRIVGREIPDYVICEDKITSLPGEIADNLLHSHSNLHYERTDNDFLLRGSSVSPTRSPVRLYRSCSPIQWLSPGRVPGMYIDDDADLTTDGPSLDRVEMVRNHLEDEITSRHALLRRPQFQPDMREMHLARELDLARAGRALRNRRYEMRLAENTEYDTEYLEPSYSVDELVDSRDYDDRHGLVQTRHITSGVDPSRVFPDDVHCPRSREYNDRQGFVQERPRHMPSTEDDNLAPFGDAYPRSTKFFPDSEMNHVGGSSRNFRDHVRNRLGPAGANRLKNKLEEKEDYRYHRKQRWCDDGASGNARLKRRKS
ncbi:uncharacterized protein LOC122000953 isoform X2 [Zingiber officinale]|uniref:uncharacterized protein LOC122000953 isoform X2 n=1 Tax=Zingiber officinale TaxID=94328 RepID=UPI001C4AC096|nr:uncharacterized protein LOC122000953 isoform X2 [Zingiber officinale]